MIVLAGLTAPARSQNVNGTTGNYPFPQNRDNPYGIHSSVYNNADVLAAYNKWYADCVTATGAGGNLRVTRPNDSGLSLNSTVSEGIGYGMLIAVYMNDQNLFDKLWKYEQLHLDGSQLMNWYIDASGGTAGSGAATDADEDMAWALLMASRQWGGSGTLGTTYASLATAQIGRIYTYVNNAGLILTAGDGFGAINPSYFAPGYFHEFATATGQTGWNTIATNCYTIITNNLSQGYGNAANGLVSAWCNNAGVSQNSVGSAYTDYQYDACRTPFRVAQDYFWFGNASALAYCQKTSGFFQGVGAANIQDGYHLNGTPDAQLPTLTVSQNPGFQSAAFVGPAGVGGMISGTYGGFVDQCYNQLKGSTLLVGGNYYDECWTVMSLLMMSGNFLDYGLAVPGTRTATPSNTPVYSPTPTPTGTWYTPTKTATPTITFTPTVTRTPTVDPCASPVIRVDCGGSGGTDSLGQAWSADQAYAAGSWGSLNGTTGSTGSAIANTTDDFLYQTERYGDPVTYRFDVPNGPYAVTLKFAEQYWTSTGSRVFSVMANGVTVVTNLDLYQQAGNLVAHDVSFAVTVAGGNLLLVGDASANNATFAAIAIARQGPCSPTPTPSSTPTLTATRTPTASPSFTATASATRTPSATVTWTLTLSPSPTPSGTATSTPTVNMTASATPTGTPSSTRTSTPTASTTPTPSATLTPTASRTASSTPTSSSTSSWTPSATRTSTDTSTATLTSTHTASSTATPSVTSTATSTASSTGTPTITSTPTFSPTGTLSPTLSPTPSFSATRTPTTTPTSTLTRTPTSTASGTPSETPSFTGTATLSVTPTRTASSTATSTVTNSLTATPSSTPTGTPVLTFTSTSTATGTATASFTPTNSSTAVPTAIGTFSLTPAPTVLGTPILYPNPVKEGEETQVLLPLNAPSDVRVSIYTTAFRKVREESFPQVGVGQAVAIELKDRSGKALANGLYYLVFVTDQGRWKVKLLIER